MGKALMVDESLNFPDLKSLLQEFKNFINKEKGGPVDFVIKEKILVGIIEKEIPGISPIEIEAEVKKSLKEIIRFTKEVFKSKRDVLCRVKATCPLSNLGDGEERKVFAVTLSNF